MFSSSTTSSQRYLTFTPHSRFIICLNLPQFSNIGDESSLFPSKILGIARQLSAWIDIHGIFKGCQFRAQVQSLNKTLDTKLDGIIVFSLAFARLSISLHLFPDKYNVILVREILCVSDRIVPLRKTANFRLQDKCNLKKNLVLTRCESKRNEWNLDILDL